MQRLTLCSLAFLLAFVPSALFAKAATTRVMIEGNHVKFEIRNPRTLAPFNVWSGPGTSSPQPQSFIVDWAKGPLAAAPPGLLRYQVSFYGTFPGEKSESLLYVVKYAFDPASGHGYVYLPGAAEPNYNLDVSRILRGVEGKWFHAWRAWDEVAGRLIARGLAGLPWGEGPSCFAIRRYLAKRMAPGSDATYIAGVTNCVPSRNVEVMAEPARLQPPTQQH